MESDPGDSSDASPRRRAGRAPADGRLGGNTKGRQELLAGGVNPCVPAGKWLLLVQVQSAAV